MLKLCIVPILSACVLLDEECVNEHQRGRRYGTQSCIAGVLQPLSCLYT
jgi:hypothetical protein